MMVLRRLRERLNRRKKINTLRENFEKIRNAGLLDAYIAEVEQALAGITDQKEREKIITGIQDKFLSQDRGLIYEEELYEPAQASPEMKVKKKLGIKFYGKPPRFAKEGEEVIGALLILVIFIIILIGFIMSLLH